MVEMVTASRSSGRRIGDHEESLGSSHEGPARARWQRDDERRRPGPARGPDRRRAGRDGRGGRPARSTTSTSCSPTATAPRSATCWSRTSSPPPSSRPVPLDWCGAQTQATLGFVLMDALEAALRRARHRPAYGDRRHPHPRRRRRRRLHPRRPSRSAASCPPTRPRCSSSTARPGRTAARRAGAGSSPRPSRCEILDAPGRAGPGRRRLRRGRQRRRRHPRRPRGRRLAARGRGRHRQGPRRGPARADRRRRRPRHRHRRTARGAPLRHARGRARRHGRPSPSCGPTPPRATSPAARWGRRSTRPAGSSRHGGSRAVITDLAHLADAVAGRRRHRRRTRPTPPEREETPCPTPSKYARSRSTPSPTPASWRSSSTTA